MLYVYNRQKSSSKACEMGDRGAQHQAIELVALEESAVKIDLTVLSLRPCHS